MVCSFYDNDYICDLSVYISGLLCLWSVVLVILVCGVCVLRFLVPPQHFDLVLEV